MDSLKHHKIVCNNTPSSACPHYLLRQYNQYHASNEMAWAKKAAGCVVPKTCERRMRQSCGCQAAATTQGVQFKYPGEHRFNLSEYMVVLDKPIGLTVAADPATGQIVVQSIKSGSPAAESGLIQVGDVIKMCSAVFGEDMWQALDLRRIKWAINNRNGKVKLILERRQAVQYSSWYAAGAVGRASADKDTLQLPVNFYTTSTDDWAQEMIAPGRVLHTGFHRSSFQSAQPKDRAASAAAVRQSRQRHIRQELSAARLDPELDLSAVNVPRLGASDGIVLPYAASTPAGWSSSSSNNSSSSSMQARTADSSSNPASSSTETVPQEKKIRCILPWLVVSTARLEPRDINHIASTWGLGAMLTLELSCNQQGCLIVGKNGLDSNNKGSSTSSGSSSSNSSSTSKSSVSTNGNSPAAATATAPVTISTSSNSSSTVAKDCKLPSNGKTLHSEECLRCLVSAAAALQRLAVRRGGSMHPAKIESCIVLLHCQPGVQHEVAALVAGWLHWYGRMQLQEASLCAEVALKATIEQGLLEAATEWLAEEGTKELSKVVITWKYGGLQAFVAGDLVGGWTTRVPMTRCRTTTGCKGGTSRGHFFIELRGLKPGIYSFKFIVDNTWAVDPTAMKAIDSVGNWNNIIEVHEPPPILTTKERLHLARWYAMHLAFESKMGLGGYCD